MPAPKKPNLRELILAKLAALPPRHKTWFDRLDPESKELVVGLKREWLEGVHKTSAIRLAELIATTLRESGESNVGTQGVVAWLRKPI